MRRGRKSISVSKRGVRAGYRLGCLIPLVAACAGIDTATAGPPTAAPVLSSPSPTPSVVAARPTIDPVFCELAIDAGDAFETVLYKFTAAYLDDDTETMDQLVDDTVGIARSLIERVPDGTQFSFRNFREKLTALSESRLKYLTGDFEPFTEAVTNAAIAGKNFRVACI